MASKGKILVVDDERGMREFLEIMLKNDGFEVETAGGGRDAFEKLDEKFFDIVICDVKMPQVDGLAVLRKAKETWPDTAVIMITAYASAETAVEAMKEGALDYITKPFKVEEVRVILRKAMERRSLEKENELLRKQVRKWDSQSSIVGKSPAMDRVFTLIQKIANTPTNVLVTGESGTGKELVAKAIHYQSDRAAHPFVTIHCGAIPENLIESELFGHIKGAFTGAIQNKIGLLEMADGGTVFLDEVGEIPLPMQVKLLRFIQERVFRRVGSTENVQVGVRIICATNKDLEREVERGTFREDLYYRLNVIQIPIPRLAERKEDIPLLSEHFVKKYVRELNRKISRVSSEAMEILMGYAYPGNVRELENILERAVALETSSVITPESLPSELLHGSRRGASHSREWGAVKLPEEGVYLENMVEDMEKRLIQQALDRCHGVKKKAAGLLHVSFRSLRYRLDKYGMNGQDQASTEA